MRCCIRGFLTVDANGFVSSFVVFLAFRNGMSIAII